MHEFFRLTVTMGGVVVNIETMTGSGTILHHMLQVVYKSLLLHTF